MGLKVEETNELKWCKYLVITTVSMGILRKIYDVTYSIAPEK